MFVVYTFLLVHCVCCLRYVLMVVVVYIISRLFVWCAVVIHYVKYKVYLAGALPRKEFVYY